MSVESPGANAAHEGGGGREEDEDSDVDEADEYLIADALDKSEASSSGYSSYGAHDYDSDDDETVLEEEVRPPSPTKRDRAASEDFWDADHVPREWVAPKPAKRARAVYRCSKCGQPKKGHLCPFA